jgi:hypothetical protein
MLEFLLEVIGEFLLQAIAEILFEFGFHALGEPFRRPPNPWIAAVGYLLFGAILGGLPPGLPQPLGRCWGALRVVNLVVTPLVVGSLMAVLGRWRAHRGESVLRIDRFAYGYLFALALALVRFWFAK